MRFSEQFEAQVLSRTPEVVASGAIVDPNTGWWMGAIVFGRGLAERSRGASHFGLDLIIEHDTHDVDHGEAAPNTHANLYEDMQDTEVMPGPNGNLLVRIPDSAPPAFRGGHIHFVRSEPDLLDLRQENREI